MGCVRIVAGPETGGNVKWQYFKFICVTISGSFRSIDRSFSFLRLDKIRSSSALENRRVDTNTRGGRNRRHEEEEIVTRKAAGGSSDEERSTKGDEGDGERRRRESQREERKVSFGSTAVRSLRLDSPSKFIGRGEREMSLDSLSFTAWSFVFLPPLSLVNSYLPRDIRVNSPSVYNSACSTI